jgi:colanic acid/amylovoran biosynthesis glycosyltransferase
MHVSPEINDQAIDSSMLPIKRLVILPTLRIKKTSGGKFILTKKFIDGVMLYSHHWGGPICVLGQDSSSTDDNLDHIEVSNEDLSFETKISTMDRWSLTPLLGQDDVLLLSLEEDQCSIPDIPEFKKLAKIYVSEYTLKTRIQIVFCRTKNPLKLIKGILRESVRELRYRRAVAHSDGVQCNGTPTFDSYTRINKNAILYFDSRVSEQMLATDRTILERSRSKDEALRLVFSGRLNTMKGADHLVDVADHLVALGVNFEMTICGGGVLEESMKRRIESLGLDKSIKMAGVLDFNEELVPFVKQHADVFVCCHRQGDPSCTYLETMSCGVPIIGYDNEAFRGIVKASGCGWITPMDDPLLMARKIAELAQDRAKILEHSHAALRFAQQHTFEKTFSLRIDHIKTTSMKKQQDLLA